jgi:hypothetical protein
VIDEGSAPHGGGMDRAGSPVCAPALSRRTEGPVGLLTGKKAYVFAERGA